MTCTAAHLPPGSPPKLTCCPRTQVLCRTKDLLPSGTHHPRKAQYLLSAVLSLSGVYRFHNENKGEHRWRGSFCLPATPAVRVCHRKLTPTVSWLAQSVECPTSAQVMISQFTSLSPIWALSCQHGTCFGSSVPLSLPLPCLCTLSLSKRNPKKKEKKKRWGAWVVQSFKCPAWLRS